MNWFTWQPRGLGCALPTHQTRKPFYTTPRRQKDSLSRKNYASELHQVMVLRLSKIGRTSCERMVGHGRVHFMLFSKYSFHLYEKLREDGFVPDDLDRALSTLPSTIPRYRRSNFLYTLNNTFIVDFSSFGSVFLVITEQGATGESTVV